MRTISSPLLREIYDEQIGTITWRNKTGESSALYSVGEIGNGMQYTMERASLLREIRAVAGSRLIFYELLPLMGVEFVRYGMITVPPFPFKYLRDYITAISQNELEVCQKVCRISCRS